MKCLIALSVLASASVFASEFDMNHRSIRCYEPAPQGERGDLVYKLEERGQGPILHLVHPFNQPLRLNEVSGCLEHPGDSAERPARLTLCPSQGQRINGLVPVEAKLGYEEEETVYCEKKIDRWFDVDSDLFSY